MSISSCWSRRAVALPSILVIVSLYISGTQAFSEDAQGGIPLPQGKVFYTDQPRSMGVADLETGSRTEEIIDLPGFSLAAIRGIDLDPITGEIWTILVTNQDPSKNTIASVDRSTSLATAIFTVDESYADMAFTPDGRLWALTTDDGPENVLLVELDRETGEAETVLDFGPNTRPEELGEALTYSVVQELLIRMSGTSTANGDQVFQYIDPVAGEVVLETNDPFNGLDIGEVSDVFTNGWCENFFVADLPTPGTAASFNYCVPETRDGEEFLGIDDPSLLGVPNDRCAQPSYANPLPYEDVRLTSIATTDPSDPTSFDAPDCMGLPFDRTTYYVLYNPPGEDRRYLIDAAGSNYDVALALGGENCNFPSDSPCGLNSLEVDLVAGTVYTLMVAETNAGAAGDLLRLRIEESFFRASDGTLEDGTELTWKPTTDPDVAWKLTRTLGGTTDVLALLAHGDSTFFDPTGISTTVYTYELTRIYRSTGAQSSFTDTGYRNLFAPDDFAATDRTNEHGVLLTWSDLSSIEDAYVIYRREAGTADPFVEIATLESDFVQYLDTTAAEETAYDYCIEATRLDGGISTRICGVVGEIAFLNAPGSVRATDGIHTDRVRITWNDNTHIEEGYYIYRRDAGTSDPFVLIGTVDPDTTYFEDTADLGSAFTYGVTAFRTDGVIVESAQINDDGIGGPETMAVPTDMVASFNDFDDRITIIWTDPSENETKFSVYREGQLIGEVSGSATQFNDLDVQAGIVQEYCVVAEHEFGGSSVAANACVSGRRSVILAPISVTATEGEFEDRTDLAWDTHSTTTAVFEIRRNGTSLKILPPTARSYSDHTGLSGVSYDYSVRGLSVNKTPSDSVGVFGHRELNEAGSVEATDGTRESRVDLSWTDESSFETGYRILRLPEGDGGPPTLLVELSANQTAYRDTTGDVGVEYEYHVLLEDQIGPDSESVVDLGYRDLAHADDLVASDDEYEEKVVLEWKDVSASETGYAIWRDFAPLTELPPNTESFEDLTTVVGSSYTYEVFPIDIAPPGTGPSSPRPGVASDVGSTVLLPPGSVGASDNYSDRVSISWVDRSALESGFRIGYEDPAGVFNTLGTVDSNITTFDDPAPAAAGVVRRYFVETVAGGESSTREFDDGSIEAPAGETPIVLVDPTFQTNDGLFFLTFATDGKTAVTGGDNEGARIYSRNESGEWELVQRIRESDANSLTAADIVDVDGDLIAINWDDPGGNNYTQLYEFDGEAWVAATINSYGEISSISLDGTVLVQTSNTSSDWVVIFDFNSTTGQWEPVQVIDQGERVYNLQVDGDILVVRFLSEVRYYKNTGSVWQDFGAIFDFGITGFGSDIDVSNGKIAVAGRDQTLVYDTDDFSYQIIDYGAGVGGNFGDVSIDGDFLAISDTALDTFPVGVFYNDPETGWTEKVRYDSPTGLTQTTVEMNGGSLLFGRVSQTATDIFATEVLSSPTYLAASDSEFENKVRIEWDDVSNKESGYRIYRDGAFLAETPENSSGYNDFDARPGVVHEYQIAAYGQGLGEIRTLKELGRRPADGFIGGRIATRAGTAVDSVEICLDPVLSHSLFFDANGGYAQARNVAFPTEELTLDFWATSQDIAATTRRSLWEAWPIQVRAYNGDLEFRFASSNVIEVPLPTDRDWHHYAATFDFDNEMVVYMDGVEVGSLSINQPLSSYVTTVIVGGDPSVPSLTSFLPEESWMGQLDDIRVWSRALTGAEVATHRSQRTPTDNPDLFAYWTFDETEGNETSDLASGGAHLELIGGVHRSVHGAPVQVCAVSDSDGNYAIPGILYGDGTTFEVMPIAEGHDFEPDVKVITIDQENPLANEVGFTDITSFGIAGHVGFQGYTACAAEGVEIFVDGELAGQAGADGTYRISVLPGEHTIEARAEGFEFSPSELHIVADRNIGGQNFVVTTRRRLALSVGGGCPGIFVGNITLNIAASDLCLEQNIVIDSMDELNLPPLEYRIEVTNVSGALLPLTDGQIQAFFDFQGPITVDLSQVDGAAEFIYRAPIELAIEGLIDPACPQFFGKDGEEIEPPDAYIGQGEAIPLTFKVFENYGGGAICNVDSATVTVFNEVTDLTEPVVVTVKDGLAMYELVGNTPNVFAGRTDAQGRSRSYQKAITAIAEAGGKTDEMTRWLVVEGARPRSGTFYSAITEELPALIVHDPPGDDSYAFYEEGEQRCIEVLTSTIDGESQEFDISLKAGVKFAAGSPFIKFSFETFATAGYGFEHTASVTDEENMLYCVKTTRAFSTSDSDLFVGPQGDVFVGSAMNVIFAPSDNLVIDEGQCQVDTFEDIRFGLDDDEPFATTYAYTRGYLERVLIPRLTWLASTVPDSATIYENQIQNWMNHLALADSLTTKALESEDSENRSFSAGAIFESTTSSDTTSVVTWSSNVYSDDQALGGFNFNAAGSGLSGNLVAKWSTETTNANIDSNSETIITGYTLSDNDAGDFFTVDIGVDPHYGTPVFQLVSGTSSCPWEPGTSPRDSVAISLDKYTLIDVPANESAVLTLTMTNWSNELREYYLRSEEIQNSGGAVIKVNGADAASPRSFFVAPREQKDVTVEVLRGPRKFSYPGLRLQAVPPCEFELFQEGDELRLAQSLDFSVLFEAPCSDITIAKPESGDTFNRLASETYSDTLVITLTDFVGDLSEAEADSVSAVNVEWRRLGAPQNWKTILNEDLTRSDLLDPTSPPDDPEPLPDIAVKWGLDDRVDGAYELRAYTKCDFNGGTVFSNISSVVVDRQDPTPFGDPEPADGELALGDPIRIVFDEPIDCNSVNELTVEITAPGVPDPLFADVSCSGNKIIIDPSSLGIYESQLLTVRVGMLDPTSPGTTVKDRAGNPMQGRQPFSTTESWSFVVSLSEFAWLNDDIVRSASFETGGQVVASLVNGNASDLDFTILNTPPWLTPSVTSGTIITTKTFPIAFTFPDTLGESAIAENPDTTATFSATVFANVSNPPLSVPLDIRLDVSCGPPAWQIDPGLYEYTMSAAVELTIASVTSTDPDDIVAAFVGNQLRGVASPQNGVAYLTIYSNRAVGEIVRFKVFDKSACHLYGSAVQTVRFESDRRWGNPDQPRVLDAQDLIDEGIQSIEVAEGWTWFSLNRAGQDMTIFTILGDLNIEPDDVIKSQTEFSIVDQDLEWQGSLTELNNRSAYLIRVEEAGDIFHMGEEVASDLPITINPGWNWVGYPPSVSSEVNAALADLTPSTFDVIKSQTEFAQYTDGSGWVGSLTDLEPGKGYKLHWGGALPGLLRYDVPPAPLALVNGQGSDAAMRASHGAKSKAPHALTSAAKGLGWALPPRGFQHNMTMIVSVEQDDAPFTGPAIVAAFSGDEVRGVADLTPMGTGGAVAFLMVHSDLVEGETISFQVYDSASGQILEVARNLPFAADRLVGSIEQPWTLPTDRVLGPGNLPTAFQLARNRPNPVHGSSPAEIGFDLPVDAQVKIEVFDVGGRLVETLVDEERPAGRHVATLDPSELRSGIYFYRMRARDFEQVHKLTVVR